MVSKRFYQKDSTIKAEDKLHKKYNYNKVYVYMVYFCQGSSKITTGCKLSKTQLQTAPHGFPTFNVLRTPRSQQNANLQFKKNTSRARSTWCFNICCGQTPRSQAEHNVYSCSGDKMSPKSWLHGAIEYSALREYLLTWKTTTVF